MLFKRQLIAPLLFVVIKLIVYGFSNPFVSCTNIYITDAINLSIYNPTRLFLYVTRRQRRNSKLIAVCNAKSRQIWSDGVPTLSPILQIN